MSPPDLPRPSAALTEDLVSWERRFGRDFPWRDSRNPFHVLSAEVFLQRTRASQVLRVYEELIDVADAPGDVIAQGRERVDGWFARLGLRWRAEHYWDLCRELVAEYGGQVPEDRKALMSLPGVGQYAAGSTLTYAFSQPTGVVDSNILRVYSRYYGIEFSDSDRRRKDVLDWVHGHVPADPERGRLYSLGLLDLGALVCTPGVPDCPSCPLVESCLYARANL